MEAAAVRVHRALLSAHDPQTRSSLIEDIDPLLPAGVRFNDDDAVHAFERVWRELIARIKGDPWKLTEMALEELRAKKYPGLLSS